MTKKYRVKNTTILHNGESKGEGSIIELTDEQAKKLADYVELVEDTQNTSNNPDTSTNTSNTPEDNNGQTQNSNQQPNEPINQPTNQTDNTVSNNGNTEPTAIQSDTQSGSKKNKRGGNNVRK